MTGVVKRVALAIGWRRQLARMRFCLAATATSASASVSRVRVREFRSPQNTLARGNLSQPAPAYVFVCCCL